MLLSLASVGFDPMSAVSCRMAISSLLHQSILFHPHGEAADQVIYRHYPDLVDQGGASVSHNAQAVSLRTEREWWTRRATKLVEMAGTAPAS